MATTVNNPIELTIVIVPDKSGQYTAFFAQFPEAIAVGEDENDAERRLIKIFTLMLNDRKEEMMKKQIPNAEYHSKSANLVLA